MAGLPNRDNRAGELVDNAIELDGPGSRQLTLDLGHTPSHAEVDFIISAGNRLAYEHIVAFPRWPGPLTLIMGPSKSGKSHLARIWAARAGAQTAMPAMLATLAGEGGRIPVLVEDTDRSGYEEQALFHLLNQSMRDGRPLLMTARLPVSEWPYRTADLLSRARLASAFMVEAPDDMQLSHMLVKLFGDRQVSVDAKIIAYVVARMERSTEEVVILVALMDKLALTRGTPVTRAIAAEALNMRAGGALQEEG